MEVYIGLDVSLARTAICVLGEKGKIVTEAQVASAPDSLVSFLLELPRGIAAIGLEAGPRPGGLRWAELRGGRELSGAVEGRVPGCRHAPGSGQRRDGWRIPLPELSKSA